MAPALPFLAVALAAAGTATSIYELASAPKAPEAPSPTQTTQQNQQSLEAAYAQADILKQRRGAASTILTGPQGTQSPSTTLKASLGG